MNDGTRTLPIPAQRAEGDPVERWLPVVGYEGIYEVSDFGRVKSLARVTIQGVTLPDRLLRPSVARTQTSTQYPQVGFCVDGKHKTFTVHSLIAEAFIGPRPVGLVVRHLDGDCTNSVLSNLVYGTYSENNSDTVKHGKNVAANKTHCLRGHEFNAINTYVSRTGHRRCRPCAAAYQMTRNKRIRAQAMAAAALP